jgi:nicotinamide riboside transporter PnuC
MLAILPWAFAVLSIIGAIANATQRRWGFHVWIVANIGWVAYDFALGCYAQSFLFIFFTCTNIYGLIYWKRNEDKP